MPVFLDLGAGAGASGAMGRLAGGDADPGRRADCGLAGERVSSRHADSGDDAPVYPQDDCRRDCADYCRGLDAEPDSGVHRARVDASSAAIA